MRENHWLFRTRPQFHSSYLAVTPVVATFARETGASRSSWHSRSWVTPDGPLTGSARRSNLHRDGKLVFRHRPDMRYRAAAPAVDHGNRPLHHLRVVDPRSSVTLPQHADSRVAGRQRVSPPVKRLPTRLSVTPKDDEVRCGAIRWTSLRGGLAARRFRVNRTEGGNIG
jgi:hypothetical protein